MLKSGRVPETVYAAMWRTISAGRTWQGEFHNRRRDGTEYWVSASISPIAQDDGVISHFVAVEEDITGRKDLERQLRQAKEMADTANQAKSEFLTRMSHELRTPMNAILGFAQLLDNVPSEPLSEKQKEYVGYILTGGRHLLDLINEVLDLARIESGRLSLAVETIDVRPILADGLVLAETLAAPRGIRVEDLSGDLALPRLRVDSTRFRQVLINLLSNAVKYNVEGGEVRLRASMEDGERLRIAVEDTGPGIPADRRAEIFVPFNRLGAERTDVEGSGIGLTITRKLVEQMGGEIGFESEVGRGTTFWVDFPAAPSHEGA
jgi:signal transduction histidine kinase